MISHLCNALVYQSGLFAGFYSTINLGDAEITTEEGDSLVLEEDGESVLITENGIVSGTISGFYGYAKTLTIDPNWEVNFEVTGQVRYIGLDNRLKYKDIDCGANECPSRPVTKIILKYVGPNDFFQVGGVGYKFYKNEEESHYLWALDGSPTAFKYYWILREEFNDFVPYMTELQYNSAYDSELGFLSGNHPRFGGSGANIYIFNDQLVLDNYNAQEVIGSFS